MSFFTLRVGVSRWVLCGAGAAGVVGLAIACSPEQRILETSDGNTATTSAHATTAGTGGFGGGDVGGGGGSAAGGGDGSGGSGGGGGAGSGGAPAGCADAGGCPGGFTCATSTTCKTSCSSDADCASSADYCASPGASGNCVARGAPGAVCGANDQCASDVCGTAGTGSCCTAACTPAGGICGASGCDASGACIFAAMGTSCSATTCQDFLISFATSCDGAGNCPASTPMECPGNLACASATECLTGCGSADASGDANCHAGYYCDGDGAGSCQIQGVAGADCTRDDECISGQCNAGTFVCD